MNQIFNVKNISKSYKYTGEFLYNLRMGKVFLSITQILEAIKNYRFDIKKIHDSEQKQKSTKQTKTKEKKKNPPKTNINRKKFLQLVTDKRLVF